MDNKVKYAPHAVIDELDEIKSNHDLEEVSILHVLNDISDNYTINHRYKKLHEFVYKQDRDCIYDIPYEQAVINHLLEIELLQPEREPRWGVYMNNYRINFMELDKEGIVRYPSEVTEEQARGYAELFGGEPKEIKR